MIRPSSFAVLALKALQKSMMAMPCGPSAVPTGGAGVALPAGIWIFTTATTCFLAMVSHLGFGGGTVCRGAAAHARRPAQLSAGWGAAGMPTGRRSQPGDLAELQLDRGLPTEDVDQDLDLELVLVDLHDLTGEVGEGAFLDPDRLAHVVLELGPALLDRRLTARLDLEELLHLV